MIKFKIIYSFIGMFFTLILSSCVTGGGSNIVFPESASLVLGQDTFTSSTNNAGANLGQASSNSLSGPKGITSDGTRLFIADTNNNRVLVWSSIPQNNKQAADIVLGQADLISNSPNQNGSASCGTLSFPTGVHVNGDRLFIADSLNHRVLVYNDVRTLTTGQVADAVIGHKICSDTSSNHFSDTEITISERTLNYPTAVYFDGAKIFIADTGNNRVLIYNQLPPAPGGGGLSADVVVGQAKMDTSSASAPSAETLRGPKGVFVANDKLLVSDTENNRVLIFNQIPADNDAGAPDADFVIGQQSLTANGSGSAGNQLVRPEHIHGDGNAVFIIADKGNHRVLFYDAKV